MCLDILLSSGGERSETEEGGLMCLLNLAFSMRCWVALRTIDEWVRYMVTPPNLHEAKRM